MTSKGLHSILWPLPLLSFHLLPPFPQSLGSSHTGFLAVSRTCQVYFCLQTFVIAVLSAWYALPHAVPSSFPHLLQGSAKCHFLREVLIDYCLQLSTLSPHHTLFCFLNSTPILRNSYLFTCFLLLQLECKIFFIQYP